MSQLSFKHLRVLGPAAVAAGLTFGAMPTFAQSAPPTTTTSATDCSAILFELSNPSAGSRIEIGGYVLQGLAMDKRATSGTGIDRVDFFLDSRDQGGINLGEAVPGVTPGPFGADSFQTTLELPNLIGGHDLVAYAHSTATGQESVISVPIALGEDSSKAGETTSASPSDTCLTGRPAASTSTTTTVTSSPTTTTTTPATTTTAPTTTTTTVSSTTSTTPADITFDVSNPSPGDTIHVGGYAIDGVAFDRTAGAGAIDRIDIFLDNRDLGGMMLGQGLPGPNNTWHALVTIPTNQTGLHTLTLYAHSSTSGAEAVVSIPVTVAP